MSALQNAIDSLSNAISNAEGYGVSGAIPTTTNNPGDLKLGDVGYGTTSSGITIFPDTASGESALENQVSKMLTGTSSNYNSGESLTEVGQTYAAGDSNWASNVASALGVPTSTTLGSIASGTTTTSSTNGTTTLDSPLLNSLNNYLNVFGLGNKAITPTASNSWLDRGVFIALGMLLVAAGIFSFKQTSTVIQMAGKAGAKAAELAA